MKKIYSIFCLTLTSVSFVHAQNSVPYTPMLSYVQPAPNIASLGKYVDYPISYYTGTPNISVPIYNITDGLANVPISLSYHASGIKVSENASWIGAGWALNAGGMITRTIKGAPDEGSKIPGTGTLPRGYWSDSGLTQMSHLPSPLNGFISAADSNQVMGLNTIWQMQAGASDGEPDLFTFNFNGYSGKFVFDEKRTPRLLADQDIKVTVTQNSTTGSFGTWIFTTPDGVKYYFGENTSYEISKVNKVGSIPDPNSTYPSSWLLTRIIYPNAKDTVYFNYAPETYSYFDLGQETKLYLGSGSGGNNTVNACAVNDPADLPSNIYTTTVSGLRLANIKSTNYTVVFGAHIQRQDVIASTSMLPYTLDSISIYTGSGQCLKQLVLAHAYFKSTTTNNISPNINSGLAGDTSDTKRLKLLSVTEVSGDGLLKKPPYVFTYQEALQLPRRISYDQDHWGFSNNANGGVNNKFTPRVSHSICNTLSGSNTFANRVANWPAMQSFSIKSIKDPLGVTTLFEFEAHTSSLLYPTSMVGGLRIHKITTTDSVTGIAQVRSFDYGLGGVLYHIPSYLLSPVNEYYWAGYFWPIISTAYRGYTTSLDLPFLYKQSQSIVPLQDFQGNHIGYPIVKEILGLNGEGGSKAYYYMADQNVRLSSRLDISNFTKMATVSNGPSGISQSGLYGNGQWNNIAPENLTYYQGYNVDDYYPSAPSQVDFQRGQLMSEETYDSGHILIKNVINVYKQTINEKNLIRGFKVFRVNRPVVDPAYPQGYYDALTFYKLHTGISHLSNKITTDYKDGKIFTNSAAYDYESAFHTQQTSATTVNSLGDSIVNKTYYSFDYAPAADPVFSKMQNRNMLVPVSNRIWKNKQLIGGSITQFKDFATVSTDTLINTLKMYALETTAPLSVAQAGENVALSSQFTSLVPNTNFIEKANFSFDGTTGRITDQKLINDKNQSMIWENNFRLPLAQIDNAYYGDVAYSGFETSEKGNWVYSATSVVAVTTPPTGSKGYAMSGGISKGNLTSSQKYVMSYWSNAGTTVTVSGGTQTNNITGKSLNGWTYHELTITGTSSLSLSGTGSVDELRLYPSTAQMTTYSYDALLRLVTTCNANSTFSYYEYDAFNRLVDIKDQYGNIIKAFEYNYGQLAR